MKSLIRVMPEPLRMGAEEADIKAGSRIFGNYFGDVLDCEISAAKGEIKLKNSSISVACHGKWEIKDLTSFIRFFIYKLFVLDRAMRQNLKFKYFMYLIQIKKCVVHPEFIAETSSMFALTSAVGGKIFTRSVNFEPKHTLTESGYSLRGKISYVIKWPSACIEKYMSKLFVISPHDYERYKALPFNGRMMLLPLRQLLLSAELDFDKGKDNFAYMGSTFNVNHNLTGLNFLLNEVFFDARLNPITFNIYGSKIPPNIMQNHERRKNIRFNGWVENLDDIYLNNNFFLAPYKGGDWTTVKDF